MTPAALIGELLELIAAVDAAVPHGQRAGGPSLARDPAGVKTTVLKRIAELERERRR
jgi:hypothetical protein